MGRVKILVGFMFFFLSSVSFSELSKEQANNLLHDGAWKGNLNRIQEAIAEGADVNSRSPGSHGDWTALSLAALGGHVDCLKYLIKHGAKVYQKNFCSTTALHWASFEISASDQIAQLLLNAVSKEAEQTGISPEEALADYINAPTYDFEVALHWAAKRGDPGTLFFLLSHPQTNIQARDNQGQTALHHAIEERQIHALRLLILGGVDTNICDEEGRSPLHYSAHRGWYRFVKILLEKGANINAKSNNGQTALHEAVILGHKRVVKFLLKKGADPLIKDKQGLKAEDYILFSKELKKLLQKAAKKKHS